MAQRLITVMLLFGIMSVPATTAPAHQLSPAQEIQLLIAFVENSDATFIRNGSRHDAAEGADHLRLKLRRGARHAKTADDFIANLATKSSWSGKPYLVEMPDGKQELLGSWLRQELERLRAARTKG